MNGTHQVSRAAIELVKPFEGLSRAATRLPDGHWSIGYGHTASAREGATVSEQDAEALLIYDLRKAAEVVRQAVFSPLSANQFDALCAFVFNVGAAEFRTSGVRQLINQGDLLKAAFAIEAWRKGEMAGELPVIDGLIRRRAAEKALFLTPDDGFVPIPTALVRPRLDTQAAFGDVVVWPVETPAAAPQPQAQTPVEPLYEIPGYAAAKEARPRPNPLDSLRIPHLLVIGLAGAVLVLVAMIQLVSGSPILAVLAGVLGAPAAFYAVYSILNRLDRGDD